MKKILTILLALTMTFAMVACDDADDVAEDAAEQVANPVTTCTSAEELASVTGINIDAPKGATQVAYSYISEKDDETEYIAQVEFTLDGNKYCYRCESTDEKSIFDEEIESDENAAEELNEMMEDAIEGGAELAGLHDKFGASASVDLQAGPEAIVAFNEGKSGFIAWVVAPGFIYSLSMSEKATQDLLQTTADKTFVSMVEEK